MSNRWFETLTGYTNPSTCVEDMGFTTKAEVRDFVQDGAFLSEHEQGLPVD